MMDKEVIKLQKEISVLTCKFNEFRNKPYLIKNKDLEESISKALTPIFKEKKKIFWIKSIVLIGFLNLIFQTFVIYYLFKK